MSDDKKKLPERKMRYRAAGDQGGDRLEVPVDGETFIVWSKVFEGDVPDGWVVLDEALEAVSAAGVAAREAADEQAKLDAEQAEADAAELAELRKFKADADAKAKGAGTKK